MPHVPALQLAYLPTCLFSVALYDSMLCVTTGVWTCCALRGASQRRPSLHARTCPPASLRWGAVHSKRAVVDACDVLRVSCCALQQSQFHRWELVTRKAAVVMALWWDP